MEGDDNTNTNTNNIPAAEVARSLIELMKKFGQVCVSVFVCLLDYI